ncbi:phosphotransferase enzyme family protein [Saccharothrix sp. Mg75]|uniref:phosphotransferase enzyme family protein n=1 Tax=Saccharothrix sp. Mg75 TaxID=3445357 RepID=UPI003EEA1D99
MTTDESSTQTAAPAYDVLITAGVRAGVPTAGAELIRDGGNVLYRLPGQVVARIGPAGSYNTATHAVRVARWLATTDVPAVRVLDDVEQPTMVGQRPVTWWAQLPEHRYATPTELGTTLRRIHTLAAPDSPRLPLLDPFSGLDEVIANATTVADHDRRWLVDLLADLRHRYAGLQSSLPQCVIHGDAWQGNLAVPENGPPTLVDLDRVGLGPREWDLIPLAVDHTDFARITPADYDAFVDAYGGHDVTTHPGYRTLATTTELRWTAFTLRKAETDHKATNEATHRLACLRGDIQQPWKWTAF